MPPTAGLVIGARDQAVVLGQVLRLGRDRPGLGGGEAGPAGRGHVGGLVGDRGRDVADEVEAVPVGQPRRREQVPDLAVRHARRCARRRRRPDTIRSGWL